MEFLLNDAGNAKQLSSLGSATLSPSEKGDDFAKLVKELEQLPKADSPVKAAVEKEYAKGAESDSKKAVDSPAEPSPRDLLKQLDTAKKAADDIEKGNAESAKNAIPIDLITEDKAVADSAEQTASDSYSLTQSSETNESLNSKAEPESAVKANSAGKSETDPDIAQAANKQSGSELPLNSAASDDADDTKASSILSSETKTSNTSSNQLGVSSSKTDSTISVEGETNKANPQSAKDLTDSKVLSEAANAKSIADTGTAEVSGSKAIKGTEGELDKSAKLGVSANQVEQQKATEKELNKTTTFVSGAVVKDTDKTLQNKVESEQLKSASGKEADTLKQANAGVDSKQEKAAQINSDTNRGEPLNTQVDARAKQAAKVSSSEQVVIQQTANDTKVAQNADAGKMAETNLNVDAKTGETKPRLASTQSNLLAPKTTSTDASPTTDKLAAATIAASADSTSKDTSGEQKEQQHSQTQQHVALNQTEAPKPQEHHSIFRSASGADVVARAEQANSDVALKQAQQANQINDKQVQQNERLNPAHYQAPAELNQRVQYMLSQGMQKAEIRLDPAELGSMHIRLQMNQEQQVSVQIQVQNPQAREALEQTMPRLREMLQQQGIELGQSQVNQQNQGNASQHGQGQNAGSGLAGNIDNIDDVGEQDLSALVANQANSDGIDFYA
ncbi:MULTISPECIES: flagellar hook-length control protein FliK [unclassified Agarivorans]|uniref:flagellar hook-length control protein FliK n=1 Tax=unclassified Agarivorans TaxID=2636026 RepID=UPI0026E434FB|nr:MULTISPECIES: flagellar hook-length control protein FliK [unclassified Agarivorans]MDO6686212.1 flagellar hook-length control protein FliK [Agarivorans sp. 3_MG-2023]MDO6716339.1 flagellar hook-length control protein FliK [Agarivorans sp. 2_MG-2023]